MIEACGVLLLLTLITFIQQRNDGYVPFPEKIMTLSLIVMLSLVSIIGKIAS